ncbi:glycosyltransferase [Oscillatoria sp. FACHB-1406]|uniref:glycosyltransferase family 4 protein n=1 Tax=Oscillatoria sp. FACHB-1406 TaxID=2692846 RepID=UPI00168573D1|nr:glycosyltransferase [Oscillatoria sp. FACHB-1406]MBD2578278.1 glycosyltransferase [Oscillatoria sp. FACHB-1406]
MKILLSCFACEPGQGSEEGVGWNVAVQSARFNEVWVITREFCRPPIEEELQRNPIPNLHFVYVEPFGWKESFKGRQGGLQLHYYLWQILAYRKAKELHRKLHFDVTRHVTYVKFWSPSLVGLLPVPFIWGPIGGGESAPKPFWRDFSTKGKLYEFARDVAQRIGELDPLTRLTARRSVFTPVTTEDTAKRVRPMGAKNVQIYSEAGLSKDAIARLGQYTMPSEEPIRFISLGRLLHWKGYHLSVRAFAKANLPNAEYWLLGDGPDREHLETIARELGCEDRIKFWGRRPREESLEKLGASHVLVHPSLHDSGGWTCLEGMAAGRPIICLALGGPDTQVTEETGIKVPARNPEQAVRDLAEAMTLLAKNASLREQLGEGGKKRVREVYDWDAKGEFFAQLYDKVRTANSSR